MKQRVKMLKTVSGRDDDAGGVIVYEKGGEYEIGPSLLGSFIDLGAVSLVSEPKEPIPEPKATGPAPENKALKGSPENKAIDIAPEDKDTGPILHPGEDPDAEEVGEDFDADGETPAEEQSEAEIEGRKPKGGKKKR